MRLQQEIKGTTRDVLERCDLLPSVCLRLCKKACEAFNVANGTAAVMADVTA